MFIDRRHMLAASASTLFAAAVGPGASAQAPVKADAKNPLMIRTGLYTVVTPDIDASLRFYDEIMGYPLLERGVLHAGQVPQVEGAGPVGRAYAFVRAPGAVRGTIRLLQAAPGAAANRPRPEAKAWDPGAGIMECFVKDIELSYEKMTHYGVKSLSPPTYYAFRDMPFLNGGPGYSASLELITFSPFGPAGEQFYISTVLGDKVKYDFPGLHGPIHNMPVGAADKLRHWAFYDDVFAIKPAADIPTALPSMNRLLGAPFDSVMHWGAMANIGMEWSQWEKPRTRPERTWPTSLGRTGVACFTFFVNDLEDIGRRARRAGAPILGQGVLPFPGGEDMRGFFLRGASGELIEVAAKV